MSAQGVVEKNPEMEPRNPTHEPCAAAGARASNAARAAGCRGEAGHITWGTLRGRTFAFAFLEILLVKLTVSAMPEMTDMSTSTSRKTTLGSSLFESAPGASQKCLTANVTPWMLRRGRYHA